MDLVFELLGELFKGMNPGQIGLVLIIILLTTGTAVLSILGAAKKKIGLPSFFNEGSGVSLSTIKESVEQLSELIKEQKRLTDEARAKVFAEIEKTRTVGADGLDDNHEIISKVAENLDQKILSSKVELTRTIDDLKAEMVRQIDDFKRIVQANNTSMQYISENQKVLITTCIDLITKVYTQLDKHDDFLKAGFPEIKQNIKEISKDISDLSKDIALLEMSVQTSFSRVRSIELK